MHETQLWRLKNTKTGLYLNGYGNESDIGRFYKSSSSVQRAV
jgi:hypothetical protein